MHCVNGVKCLKFAEIFYEIPMNKLNTTLSYEFSHLDNFFRLQRGIRLKAKVVQIVIFAQKTS